MKDTFMNEIIAQIFSTGYVEDAQGRSYPNSTSSVTFEAGTLLYDVVRTLKPDKTLETGMAYGISTLFICQAHRDNGAGSHTAIDPFQEQTFKSIGLANIGRAHLTDVLRFYQAASDEVLPQLCAQQERFDFAFIDGNHRFDYALVDFFYIDKLLNLGGHVAFDDLWIPAVRKVASFVLRNTPYKLVHPSSKHKTPAWRHALRTGRRIVQNPLGRDWALKLVPQNVALLQKVASEPRSWKNHRAF
jgi:predicted O-methyltransferase YrrM